MMQLLFCLCCFVTSWKVLVGLTVTRRVNTTANKGIDYFDNIDKTPEFCQRLNAVCSSSDCQQCVCLFDKTFYSYLHGCRSTWIETSKCFYVRGSDGHSKDFEPIVQDESFKSCLLIHSPFQVGYCEIQSLYEINVGNGNEEFVRKSYFTLFHGNSNSCLVKCNKGGCSLKQFGGLLLKLKLSCQQEIGGNLKSVDSCFLMRVTGSYEYMGQIFTKPPATTAAATTASVASTLSLTNSTKHTYPSTNDTSPCSSGNCETSARGLPPTTQHVTFVLASKKQSERRATNPMLVIVIATLSIVFAVVLSSAVGWHFIRKRRKERSQPKTVVKGSASTASLYSYPINNKLPVMEPCDVPRDTYEYAYSHVTYIDGQLNYQDDEKETGNIYYKKIQFPMSSSQQNEFHSDNNCSPNESQSSFTDNPVVDVRSESYAINPVYSVNADVKTKKASNLFYDSISTQQYETNAYEAVQNEKHDNMASFNRITPQYAYVSIPTSKDISSGHEYAYAAIANASSNPIYASTEENI